MRNLHSFLYLGGLFSILVCGLGIFLFPESTIDGIMYIAAASFVPSILCYPFLPIGKMVSEEIPDEEIRVHYQENLDIEKWKKEKIKNEKEKLLTPFFLWIGFLCIAFTRINDPAYPNWAYVLLYVIATFAFGLTISIITHEPKPTTKQMIHHA
jgi:hypothetical protein